MALADLFKKKEPPKPQPIPGMDLSPAPELSTDVPISQVVSMQAQGLSNNQIIQSLQRQGYQPQQIYDALAQAEAKKHIEPMFPEEPPAMSREPPKESKIDTEALVEQIIEEKWRDLQKELSALQQWKESMTTRMDKLDQQVSDVKADVEGLHKAILARVGEYDKTLLDVGTEIKAMEKVFQQVLPELTSNIQELSRVTKTVKKTTSRSNAEP